GSRPESARSGGSKRRWPAASARGARGRRPRRPERRAPAIVRAVGWIRSRVASLHEGPGGVGQDAPDIGSLGHGLAMVIRIHSAGIGEPTLRVGGYGDSLERVNAAQHDDQAGDALVVGDLTRKGPNVGTRLGGREIPEIG